MMANGKMVKNTAVVFNITQIVNMLVSGKKIKDMVMGYFIG
jgi:hypothetical protein